MLYGIIWELLGVLEWGSHQPGVWHSWHYEADTVGFGGKPVSQPWGYPSRHHGCFSTKIFKCLVIHDLDVLFL